MSEVAFQPAASEMGAAQPPKVLHVVGMMGHGSAEAWLLRLLAHARRRGAALDWTFYGAFGLAGDRDAEAEALGARVVRSPVPIGDKLAFARALRGEIAHGRYDVLHFHHDLVSGVYLLATAGLPARLRVVHVHNLDESVLTPDPVKQAVLRPLLRGVCLSMADRIVANSGHALAAFLAGRRAGVAHRVLPIAIDAAPFAARADRAGFRQALGLAAESPILLFAGRMTPEKNPVFAVDVLAALRRRLPQAVAVFAGDGDLGPAVAARAAALGQAPAVRLLGWRGDIAAVMSACDWFILPHPHRPAEAFGAAVVEAQLAGLRLLLSLGVSDAPILPSASWRRLSLDAGADAWADAALELWRATEPCREQTRAELAASPMDLDRNLAGMRALHA